MKISLFQGILIAVFVISAFAGLFAFSNYTGNKNEGKGFGPVTIWGILPEEEMKTVLSAVAGQDETFKDVTYVQKDSSMLSADLASAIATNSGPDLVLTSQEELRTLSKYIIPLPFKTLSKNTFTNTFIDGARILETADGYYGVPFLVDPLVLFSNKSILASNGIIKPPATWESLNALVPSITILTPTRQISRALIALGTYNNVNNARGILASLFFQTGIPMTSYAKTGQLEVNLGTSSRDNNNIGQGVLNFYTQFSDASKASYTWNVSLPSSKQLFVTGDVALYLGYVSEARALRSVNPNLNFNVSVLPQPENARTKSAFGLLYSFMIPNGAKNPSGAYQAATILVSQAAQALVANVTGLAPVNLNALGVAQTDPVSIVAYTEALYTRGWLSPAPADTDAIFSSMITNVISNKNTSEDALGFAERSLSALLSP